MSLSCWQAMAAKSHSRVLLKAIKRMDRLIGLRRQQQPAVAPVKVQVMHASSVVHAGAQQEASSHGALCMSTLAKLIAVSPCRSESLKPTDRSAMLTVRLDHHDFVFQACMLVAVGHGSISSLLIKLDPCLRDSLLSCLRNRRLALLWLSPCTT